MADIRLVWNQAAGRADWTVVDGRLAAGGDLESVVLLLLFTDRRAQPGYRPTDGTTDLRGWWGDSFQPILIGSRLWQLRRRKIANRAALAAEADGMVTEALDPMVTYNLASAVLSNSFCPPAGPRNAGNLLVIQPTIVLPTGKRASFAYNYTLS